MNSLSDRTAIEEALTRCERVLEYEFSDKQLLERCITHASIARTRLDSNERLEFLGDAILGMVTCEALFERFPGFPEGELTRLKSVLVSRNMCAQIAGRIGLDDIVLTGRGLRDRGAVPPSVVAAVFESVIAGLYLDGGLEVAREFILRELSDEISAVHEERSQNFKSILQQVSQKRFGHTPTYHLLDEKGPDHSKCFKIAAWIGSDQFPSAWGANKKEAEQRAAQNAISVLEDEDPPHPSDE